MHNWSGHVEFSSRRVAAPTSVAELQRVVTSEERVHALGTAHSFSDLADTRGTHVTLEALPQDVVIDGHTAWLPAAMRYGQAATLLQEHGLAFHNLASLPHISVAGSVATGTHGSGDRNGTLSAAVTALEVVLASGDVVTVREGDEDFAGMVVGLGALGIATRLAVRVEPDFRVRQVVYDGVPREAITDRFDEAFSAAYSVSFFTTWGPERDGSLWLKQRDDEPAAPASILGAAQATGPRHPLPGHDPVHCTEQLGVPGPSHERLPHFRLGFTPSAGDELQTEYLVDRAAAPGLLRDLEAVAPALAPAVQVSEIRTMAADDLWLSGAYGRDTVGIHFTWHRSPDAVALLPLLDEVLGQSGGRPHWGKLFVADRASLQARYPRFPHVLRLRDRVDPGRRFGNDFLERHLGA